MRGLTPETRIPIFYIHLFLFVFFSTKKQKKAGVAVSLLLLLPTFDKAGGRLNNKKLQKGAFDLVRHNYLPLLRAGTAGTSVRSRHP